MAVRMGNVVPDDVAEVWKQAIAVQAALSGQFDDRIKQLLDLKTNMDARQGIIKTLDEAQQVRNEADSYAKVKKTEADSILAQVGAQLAAANANVSSTQTIKDSASAQARETSDGWNALQSAIDDAKERAAIRSSALDDREKAIAQRESDLAAAKKTVAATQAKLSARLSALDSVS